MAQVILGGLLTSTFLNLVVVPVLFARWGEERARAMRRLAARDDERGEVIASPRRPAWPCCRRCSSGRARLWQAAPGRMCRRCSWRGCSTPARAAVFGSYASRAEPHTARPHSAEQTFPWLVGAVALGGVAGPVLLLSGFRETPAAVASLLLNLEGVFTAHLAWFVFRENFDRRIALGCSSSWRAAPLLGVLAIAAASLC